MQTDKKPLPAQARRLAFHLIICLSLFTLFWSSTSPGRAQAEPEAPKKQKLFIPMVVQQNSSAKINVAQDWLRYLNQYRTMAGLPDVSENPVWSRGDEQHARYMVKTDRVEHDEQTDSPYYTPEGKAAAQNSNLVGSGDLKATDRYAIEAWIQAPFHGVGVLDPELHQIGFGSFREADGSVQMAAAMDVLRGLGSLAEEVNFPVHWPGAGSVVAITSFWGEHPDPLTSCPGYTTPAGLPVIFQIGSGSLTPQVTASSLKNGSTALEHCVFSEATYTNPASADQSLGRSILDARDAVILVPRQPLVPGASYTVSLTVNGQAYTWSFKVAQDAETQANAVWASE